MADPIKTSLPATGIIHCSYVELLSWVKTKLQLRRSPRLYAAVDIMRIASVAPAVSRYHLTHGCLSLSKRYHTKTIDRAMRLLIDHNLLSYCGQRQGRGGGARYCVPYSH